MSSTYPVGMLHDQIDTLAFLRGLPQLVDFAASCGIESSGDGNGVAFEVLPPVDFWRG